MNNYKHSKEDILDRTNGGRDIIERCYPDAVQGSGTKKNFKTHDETDPSSSMFLVGSEWKVKNFTTGKTYSAFDCIIETQSSVKDFAQAILWTVAEFNLGEGKTVFGGASLSFKPALEGQKHDDYYFDFKDKLTDFELSVIGPLFLEETARKFKLKAVHSFTQIKQYYKGDKLYAKYGSTPQQIITKSTENYPIFVFDYGDWQKVYQPLNKEKRYRFRYIGKKPKDFVFGLDTLEDALHTYKYDQDHPEETDIEKLKLPAILIGSGDRDSLNIASLGYPVVWLNSESAKLEYDTYKELKEFTRQVYYLGDIDVPGIAQGIEIALQYRDLKVIWLPNWIQKSAYRGKPRKDLKDWIDLVHKKDKPQHLVNEFKKMVNVALPARFWDSHFNSKGEFTKYTFNNAAAFQFLWYNGFHIYKDESKKDPYQFIQINKGIVSKRVLHEVANFPADYVESKKIGIPLLNFLHRSGQLTERMLSKLPIAEPNFRDHTANSQLYFFENEIWNITPDAIEKHAYGKQECHVWEDKIIPAKVHIDTSPVFKITNKGTAHAPDYDIEILRTDNPFFNFLINSSRVHWKVNGNDPFMQRKREIEELPIEKQVAAYEALEAEYIQYHQDNQFNLEEKGLTAQQIKDQKQHLINKICCIGYLLHKHRKENQPWIVYAMDDRISEISQSHGGTGKSIVFNNAIKWFLSAYKDIDGADDELYKSSFLFDGVDKYTDYVIVDDADQYFPIKKWKSRSTGNFTVNPKGTSAYTIKFEDSPKIAITTNFGLYEPDSSLTRRLLFYVASDFYHFNDKRLYKKSHEPKHDFGKMLIKDFNDEEMNGFYNVMAQMCQAFLQIDDKVDPPSGNIEKRNAIQSIGDAFHNWANSFFYDRKNCYILKKEAFASFEETAKVKGWTSQKFKSKLETWCEIDNLEMNPHKSLNKQGYCKYTREGKTQEFIYIRTAGKPVKEYSISSFQNDQIEDAHNHFKNIPNGDLPI